MLRPVLMLLTGAAIVSAGLAAPAGAAPPAAVAAPSAPVAVATVSTAAPRGLTVNPAPAVLIDTDATVFGLRGINVKDPNAGNDAEGAFYDSKMSVWLQVVALNRSDLSLIWNKDYLCPGITPGLKYIDGDRAAAACISRVQADLATLDKNDLVIATNRNWGASSPGPYGVVTALKGIGVAPAAGWRFDQPVAPGTFTAIGVPGAAKGEAWQAASPSQTVAGDLDIRALLTRNNKGRYDVMDIHRISYTTHAKSSDANSHVMRIGNQKVTAKVDGGGYHVAWADRFVDDPAPIQVNDAYFATSKGGGEISRMIDRLWSIVDNDQILLVSSVGAPLPTGGSLNYQTSKKLRSLAEVLAYAGGTLGNAYRPIDLATAKGASYSLVSYGSAGAANGSEDSDVRTKTLALRRGDKFPRGSSEQAVPAAKKKCAKARHPRKCRQKKRGKVRVTARVTEGDNNAELSGVLVRDQSWRYVPGDVFAGSGDGESPLVDTIASNLSEWPGSDDSSRTAALAWVGDEVGLGNTPRGMYWTQDYRSEYWNEKLAELAKLNYDPAAHLARGDFEWARDQLTQEIGWVMQAYSYLALLAKPYSAVDLKSWAAMTKVADDVDKAVGTSNDAKVQSDIGKIAGASLELLEEMPKVGEWISRVAAVYELGVSIAEVVIGEPAESEFTTTVADLGVTTAKRLSAAQDTISDQFSQMIVSDYAKLKRVGTCVVGAKSCADAPDWQITAQGRKAAVDTLSDSLNVTFYQALLPAKYKLFELPMGPRKDAAQVSCPINIVDLFDGSHPWKGAPANVSVPVRRYSEQRDGTRGLNTVYAFGYTDTDIHFVQRMYYPKKEVLDPLFGSDELNVDRGMFVVRTYDKTIWTRGAWGCFWPNDSVSLGSPQSREPGRTVVGGKVFRDVDVTMINQTGEDIWVASHLQPDDRLSWTKVPDGGSIHQDSKAWEPTMLRLDVMFHDPADGGGADRLQVINPTLGQPYLWNDNTAGDRHYWELDVNQVRGSTGWMDQSYQDNGWAYNLWMKRGADDYHTMYFTLVYTLQTNSPF